MRLGRKVEFNYDCKWSAMLVHFRSEIQRIDAEINMMEKELHLFQHSCRNKEVGSLNQFHTMYVS